MKKILNNKWVRIFLTIIIPLLIFNLTIFWIEEISDISWKLGGASFNIPITAAILSCFISYYIFQRFFK